MLVVFKSAPILKRALKVKQAMMQLYVLKLLKIQTKYLGRQWRKSNMKTMSAIYQKVRHRMNDDWAYGNGEYWQAGTSSLAANVCAVCHLLPHLQIGLDQPGLAKTCTGNFAEGPAYLAEGEKRCNLFPTMVKESDPVGTIGSAFQCQLNWYNIIYC